MARTRVSVSGARAVPGSDARVVVPGSVSSVGWRQARSRLRCGSGVGAFAAPICRRVRLATRLRRGDGSRRRVSADLPRIEAARGVASASSRLADA